MVIYMEQLQNNPYRYERKYVLSKLQLPLFYNDLYGLNYSILYPQRTINNIYFDDSILSSLDDNIQGLSMRKKYRLRWYGKPLGLTEKNFEIKIKSEFLNSKKIIRLGEIDVFDFKNPVAIKNIILSIIKKESLLDYHKLTYKEPTLHNNYDRNYFISKEKSIRITIDTNLNYYSFLTKNKTKESKVIVEVKYNSNVDFKNDFKNLEFTKYSKYVKGIISTSIHRPLY